MYGAIFLDQLITHILRFIRATSIEKQNRNRIVMGMGKEKSTRKQRMLSYRRIYFYCTIIHFSIVCQ